MSGLMFMRGAGTGGAGKVQMSVLESSTVDIAKEFTTMITTQRAYSASAKIISTANEMLEELMRVKR
jgi:flagellar hook protein FlgE